jgi:Icc-related predicted phosphoesterase
MRFIGDVHGRMKEYTTVTSGCDSSVQVGDFGAGFVPLPILSVNHRFIRGNHDNPEICRQSPNWIADGTCETINNNRLLFIGGAWSVDRRFRTEGVDWWPDEECSWQILDQCIDSAQSHKPNVIVTHDCPYSLLGDLFGPHATRYMGNRTSQALDAVFDTHKPELWIFGHHHVDIQKNISGTEFVCLGELSYIDIGI